MDYLSRYYDGLKITSGVTPTSLLFDVFGQGIGGFSFFKLMTSYTGYFARLQKTDGSGDVIDLPYTANGINETALLNFAPTTGQVRGIIWYNQGYLNVNLTATWDSAPILVEDGVIYKENGIPAWKYNDAKFWNGGNNFGADTSNYLNLIYGRNSATNRYNTFIAKSRLGANPGRFSIVSLDDGNMYAGTNDNFNLYVANTTNRVLYGFTQEYKDSNTYLEFSFFKNGNLVNSIFENINFPLQTNFRYLLGAFNDASDTGQLFYLIGMIQENIIYKQTTLPSQADISNNIINRLPLP